MIKCAVRKQFGVLWLVLVHGSRVHNLLQLLVVAKNIVILGVSLILNLDQLLLFY